MGYSGDDPVSLFAYTSQAAASLSNEDFVKIVQQSWRNNTASGITGMLIYERGEFRQVIEGAPGKISPLVAAILSDTRHGDVRVTRYSLTDGRQFEDWSCIGFERFSQRLPTRPTRSAELRHIIDSGVFDLGKRRAANQDEDSESASKSS